MKKPQTHQYPDRYSLGSSGSQLLSGCGCGEADRRTSENHVEMIMEQRLENKYKRQISTNASWTICVNVIISRGHRYDHRGAVVFLKFLHPPPLRRLEVATLHLLNAQRWGRSQQVAQTGSSVAPRITFLVLLRWLVSVGRLTPTWVVGKLCLSFTVTERTWRLPVAVRSPAAPSAGADHWIAADSETNAV